MVRVLVTVEPRMYREAIAFAVQRHRPNSEVMLVPEEVMDGQVKEFAPHLLVHNDTDSLDRAAVEGVFSWVEVLYSDSMDAWIYSEGHLKKYEDISTDILLGVVDEVAERLRRP
jgi:hypothetical protein